MGGQSTENADSRYIKPSFKKGTFAPEAVPFEHKIKDDDTGYVTDYADNAAEAVHEGIHIGK